MWCFLKRSIPDVACFKLHVFLLFIVITHSPGILKASFVTPTPFSHTTCLKNASTMFLCTSRESYRVIYCPFVPSLTQSMPPHSCNRRVVSSPEPEAQPPVPAHPLCASRPVDGETFNLDKVSGNEEAECSGDVHANNP